MRATVIEGRGKKKGRGGGEGPYMRRWEGGREGGIVRIYMRTLGTTLTT